MGLLAGVAGSNSLSFASPKESKQRKGDPGCCVPPLRYGQPAVLDYGGVSRKLASLKQARSLIRLRLRSSAQPGRGKRERGQRQETKTKTNKDSPWRVLVSSGIQYLNFFSPLPPLVDAPRSAGSGGSGIALFEPKASLARPRLNRAPQVARSAAKGRSNQGRLFFCLLLVFA